jgi:hypothetical protein
VRLASLLALGGSTSFRASLGFADSASLRAVCAACAALDRLRLLEPRSLVAPYLPDSAPAGPAVIAPEN